MGMLRDLTDVVFDDVDHDLESGAERLRKARIKRVIDFTVAVAGLLFILPFLLLVAALISLDSPGPVLFRQRRTGYDGVPFVIYKFRTMYVLEDGPNILPAIRHDGRNTRLGRFLRRSSIDELPQLLNVLRGEMSLVGPRPHAIAHDEFYARTVPGYSSRFKAKPGITGLAQITGFRGEIHHTRHIVGRVARDIEYIRNWSLALDMRILFRTILIFPFQSSAY